MDVYIAIAPAGINFEEGNAQSQRNDSAQDLQSFAMGANLGGKQKSEESVLMDFMLDSDEAVIDFGMRQS